VDVLGARVLEALGSDEARPADGTRRRVCGFGEPVELGMLLAGTVPLPGGATERRQCFGQEREVLLREE
jgi:hypothetical protein